MKKMTIEQENALRATAKRCNDELKAAISQKPKPKFDSVSRPLLAKHYEKIKGLGVPFLLFVYTIGMINKQFREH
ncbi:hypothetical protein ACTJOB_17695 [Citrobacter freundii]|uniref:hypothetical protein n=1 Tax=Citrobacter freundii TaxID=546 RepID=UPI003F8A86A1